MRPKIIGDEPVPLSEPGSVTNVMLLMTGSRLPVGAFRAIARVRISDQQDVAA